MNYEQKYKEALEWIRSIYPTMQGAEKEDAEHYFPELNESEDERIRKRLLEFISCNPELISDFNAEKGIAWLEKQGEQKPTDKVEPKFKVGDWITNGEYTWKITDIKSLDYILQSPNGDVVDDTISYVDEHLHLWTIQDAKDGDVLAFDNDTIVIFKDLYNSSIFHSYCHIEDELFDVSKDGTPNLWECKGFHPATKEQRDFLLQKVKESGYEWNAKKKELTKTEQTSIWSEEDEDMRQDIISGLKAQIQLFYANDEQGKAQMNSRIDWLKSLKPRWKPTEQNIKDLEWCADLVKNKMGVGFHRLQVFIDELKNL